MVMAMVMVIPFLLWIIIQRLLLIMIWLQIKFIGFVHPSTLSFDLNFNFAQNYNCSHLISFYYIDCVKHTVSYKRFRKCCLKFTELLNGKNQHYLLAPILVSHLYTNDHLCAIFESEWRNSLVGVQFIDSMRCAFTLCWDITRGTCFYYEKVKDA